MLICALGQRHERLYSVIEYKVAGKHSFSKRLKFITNTYIRI